ncbi:hypothetical protein, partial [Brevundimonas sp.]|uniref:hypothetical protein n=1 Tax=Brevundimonas sp. TaxID=1871086 RepID=UPI002D4C153B
WRIVDSVAGRDGSTLVSSIEGLRFMTGNTTTVLTYGAPAAPEPAGKAGDAQVLPLPADLDDAFVLPALAEGEPLVLPGLEAFKPADAPLVLPGTGDEAPLFLALGARLAPAGGWMAVIDDQGRLLADPGRHGDDWMA